MIYRILIFATMMLCSVAMGLNIGSVVKNPKQTAGYVWAGLTFACVIYTAIMLARLV